MRKTNTASAAASVMFSVDSHLTPRCSPEKADATNAADSTAITTSCVVRPAATPVVSSRPSATCSAPRPRLVAVPNTVANTASRSISRPGQDSARRAPSSGTNAALSRFPRPLRKPA